MHTSRCTVIYTSSEDVQILQSWYIYVWTWFIYILILMCIGANLIYICSPWCVYVRTWNIWTSWCVFDVFVRTWLFYVCASWCIYVQTWFIFVHLDVYKLCKLDLYLCILMLIFANLICICTSWCKFANFDVLSHSEKHSLVPKAQVDYQSTQSLKLCSLVFNTFNTHLV